MATYDELMRALTAASRPPSQGGDPVAASVIAKMLKEKRYDEESSFIESAAQGIGSGATFGTIDELGAGVRSALFDPIASMVGGADIGGVEGFKDYFQGMGERYKTNLQSQRDAMETARREDPWTTGIGEAIGGLSSGGIGAAKATAGRGLMAGARNMAGVGLGTGMLAGYGYSEGDPLAAMIMGEDTETIKREVAEAGRDIKIGGMVGATIGGALPIVGAGARGLLRMVSSPFTRNARLEEEGRRRVIKALADDAEYKGFTSEEDMLRWARKELEQTPGMTLSDLGPALRELTEEVAQTPTQGGRIVRETLIDRNKEQWQRLYPKLQEAFGVEDQFHAARAKLLTEMRGRADKFYTAGHAVDQRVTPQMQAIIKNKEFRGALETANRLRALDNPKLPKLKPKELANVTEMSGRDLDYIIQGMDDVINRNFREAPAVARALKPLREAFKKDVFANNPDLKTARKLWSGDQNANDAFDMGLRILRDDADLSAAIVRGFESDSQRQAFLHGALRAFVKKLGAKPDTGDLTTIFKSENAKEALKVALGGQQKFAEFMRFIQGEQKLFGTFHQAVGNSATARRLKQTPEVGGKIAALFGYTGALASGTGAPPAIVGYGARRAYEAVAPQGRRLARERLQRGAQSEALMGGTAQLDRLMHPTTIGGLLGTGVPRSAAYGGGGLLATGLPQPDVEYGR